MRRVFLTFGDGGENFRAARDRIVREAQSTGQFDEVIGRDWSNVSSEVQASSLRNCKRGCGYWIWKPDIIYYTLMRLADGDVLVYCDCGCELRKTKGQWQRLFKRLESADILLRKIRYCAYQWTKKETFDAFCPTHIGSDSHMCFQYEASALVIKKTPFALGLIKDWRDIAIATPSLFSDPSDISAELPGFVAARHDQSVFTCLVYKARSEGWGKKFDIMWDFHFGANLLEDAAIEVVRNRKGSPHARLSIKGRVIRAMQRLVYLFQSWLEEHGIMICWTMTDPSQQGTIDR